MMGGGKKREREGERERKRVREIRCGGTQSFSERRSCLAPTNEHVVPTCALTARVRECSMMMRARELCSLARSLCRRSTLEHYLLLLTLCVVHAHRQRLPLQLMIAVDDVVVGCCHVVGGNDAVLPLFPSHPFSLVANSPPEPPWFPSQLPVLLARDSGGWAGAGGETTTTTTATASTTPFDARPSDHRRSLRRALPDTAYPVCTHTHTHTHTRTHTHARARARAKLTFSLREAAVQLTRAVAWPSSS